MGLPRETVTASSPHEPGEARLAPWLRYLPARFPRPPARLARGTSGKLYDSNLVMYDRQTQSLWVQFTGQAVAGVLTGHQLRPYPMQTVSWSEWRAGHPHGWVLSRDTGYTRAYGANPYPGYDDIHSRPFLFSGQVNGRYTAMTRVAGIRDGGEAAAVLLSALQRRRVIDLTLPDPDHPRGHILVCVGGVPPAYPRDLLTVLRRAVHDEPADGGFGRQAAHRAPGKLRQARAPDDGLATAPRAGSVGWIAALEVPQPGGVPHIAGAVRPVAAAPRARRVPLPGPAPPPALMSGR